MTGTTPPPVSLLKNASVPQWSPVLMTGTTWPSEWGCSGPTSRRNGAPC